MTAIYPLLAIFLLWLGAYTDFTRRIIRNWLSLAILLLFVLYAVFSKNPIEPAAHVLWAAGLFALMLAGFAAGKVGGGDVKLASVTMLWAGPEAGPAFLIITALAGGVLALFIVIPAMRMIQDWALAPFSRYMDPAAALSAKSVPYGVAIAAGGTVALYGRYLAGA